jgi:hypothetical protein
MSFELVFVDGVYHCGQVIKECPAGMNRKIVSTNAEGVAKYTCVTPVCEGNEKLQRDGDTYICVPTCDASKNEVLRRTSDERGYECVATTITCPCHFMEDTVIENRKNEKDQIVETI